MGRRAVFAVLAVGLVAVVIATWRYYSKESAYKAHEQEQRTAMSRLVMDSAAISEPHYVCIAIYNPTSTDILHDAIYHVVLSDLAGGLPSVIKRNNTVLMPDGSTMEFPAVLSANQVDDMLLSYTQFTKLAIPVVRIDRRFRKRLSIRAMEPLTEYVDIGLPFDTSLDAKVTIEFP